MESTSRLFLSRLFRAQCSVCSRRVEVAVFPKVPLENMVKKKKLQRQLVGSCTTRHNIQSTVAQRPTARFDGMRLDTVLHPRV